MKTFKLNLSDVYKKKKHQQRFKTFLLTKEDKERIEAEKKHIQSVESSNKGEQMTLLNAIILLGLILITFGCVFYVIAMLMERYYDRKLWELDQRLRKDDKWRDKQ
jgi:thiol:disulfide interchange protein